MDSRRSLSIHMFICSGHMFQKGIKTEISRCQGTITRKNKLLYSKKMNLLFRKLWDLFVY